MQYDEDQLRVINCEDQKIVVEAFAGAGKTTTAVGYAEKRPKKKILYICFAKANQMEAQRRFPKNTNCKTTHSIAYAAVGRLYGDRVVKSWKARHVAEDMGLNIQKATLVHASILEFLGNSEPSISLSVAARACEKFNVHTSRAQEVCTLANALWARMKDTNERVKLTHDAYLKIWALSKPQLPYDVIILDEAQDTNPVTSMVVLAQLKAVVLMIGDSHQSIFLFRGASNAMAQLAQAGATVLKMPRTWRFGARTAAYANALLQTYKEETATIIGMGQDAPYEEGQPVTFLARTNAGLFKLAAQRRGEGVHWVGGASNYRLELVLDAYYLSVGQRSKIQDPLLSRYVSWTEYKEEAERSKDAEARILIEAVGTYGADIPQLIDDIKFNEVNDSASASRVLSTAHKAKGLDWKYVKLCDDFKVYELICESLANNGCLTEDVKQEVNLLYVALTRAKSKVFLNTDSRALFEGIKLRAQQALAEKEKLAV